MIREARKFAPRLQFLVPLALAAAYVEHLRGASRRLFFRRYFQFHISNFKFLPALRPKAAFPAALGRPAGAACVAVRPAGRVPATKHKSRFENFPSFTLRVLHSYPFIRSSSGTAPAPGAEGVSLLSRLYQRPSYIQWLFPLYFYTFEAPAQTLTGALEGGC